MHDGCKENTQNRPGGFNQNAGSKICVTLQTYHCIQITARSPVQAVKFLLRNGCVFILTENFWQDSVQEYVGIQRQLRRRNNNPDIGKLGCNDDAVRIQRDVSFTPENMNKRHSKRNSLIEVSDETVPKRKSWVGVPFLILSYHCN